MVDGRVQVVDDFDRNDRSKVFLAKIFIGRRPGGVDVVSRPLVSADFDAVRRIVHERCTSCHAVSPVHPAFQAAPAGVVLESDSQIAAEAARIHHQTVVTRVMPIGNLTNISEEERALIDRWYQAGAAVGE